MRQFYALVRVQLRGLLAVSSGVGSRKKRPKSVWLMVGIMAAVSGYIGFIYSSLIDRLLEPGHSADLTLAVMATLAILVAAILDCFSVSSFVFAGKDNDLLLSMPIPPLTLVLARLSAVVVENLLPTFFLLVPAAIGYAGGHPVPFTYWPAVGAGIILITLVASTLGLLIGFVLALVQARVRHRSLVTNVLYAAFFLAIMWASTIGQSTLGRLVLQDPGALRAALAQWVAPPFWFGEAAVRGDGIALLLLTASAVLPFLALSVLLSRLLGVVTTALATHGGRVTGFRLGTMKTSSPRAALTRKELQRLFGTPIYLMNTCIGLLIMLVGAGYVTVAGFPDALRSASAAIGMPLAGVVLLALVGILAMSVTTTPSISLEGNRRWILREAPLSAGDILIAKVAANLAIGVPVVVVSVLAMTLRAGFSALDALLLILVPGLFLSVVAELGLFANLWFPRMDGASDTQVVKQSASVMVGMLLGALSALVVIISLVPLIQALGLVPASLIVAAALALAGWGLWQGLKGPGSRLLEAL